MQIADSSDAVQFWGSKYIMDQKLISMSIYTSTLLGCNTITYKDTVQVLTKLQSNEI